MYIIRTSNYDWKHQHCKTIVFEREEEAIDFFNQFANFAHMQAFGLAFFQDPEIINEVQKTMNQTEIIPLPDDYTMETINYSELRKGR